MNHINLQLSNINISSIFYYITSIFNDINFDIVLTIFLIINTILAFSIVFLEYQTTTSSWAWILVLFLIPYLGFILYLIFGRPIYLSLIHISVSIINNWKNHIYRKKSFHVQMKKKLGINKTY